MYDHGRIVMHRFVDAIDLKDIAIVDRVVVGRFLECQWEYTGIDQVLLMNAREGLCKHEAQPEKLWTECCVFPARALAVVNPANQRMTTLIFGGFRTRNILRIVPAKTELRKPGQIGAEWKSLCTSRTNCIGRNVVTER